MHSELDLSIVALVGLAIVGWSLVSARAAAANITAPMAFVALGMVVSHGPLAFVHLDLRSEVVRHLAELTLAVVLFGDAATVDVARLRRDVGLPTRLLAIGLPLTMAGGAVATHLLIPSLSWWVCALIGASIAPTDAALGAAIIEDERVPSRVRRALNVESGLNDGIATPFVHAFLVAAVVGTAYEVESEAHALRELAIGLGAGVALGAAAAGVIAIARRRSWMEAGTVPVATAAISLVAYAGAVTIGGNGFVAAFVAGLAFAGTSARTGTVPEVTFTHEVGGVLSNVVWFVFGALVVAPLRDGGWQELAIAVLALTVVRMVPVALSLLGTGMDRATVAVIGWFGPRGLASVVFALLAAPGLPPGDGTRVVAVIGTTVLLSVVAHGASAAPVASRFTRTSAAPATVGG